MANKTSRKELSEIQEIMIVLKRIMKEKKISYQELAKMVHLSESGLKKIFYGGDCSYGRLSEIASALEVKVLDILHEIDHVKSVKTKFSKTQQDFFLKDRAVFDFYVHLAIERQPLEEIRKINGLSEKTTFSYLRKLDKLKLIKLMPEEKLKLPPLKHIDSFGEGPLLETVYQDWSQNFVKELATPLHQKDGSFVIRGFSLKNQTFKELKDRIKTLEVEFLQRSIREMSLPGPRRPMRWISLIDQKSITSKNDGLPVRN